MDSQKRIDEVLFQKLIANSSIPLIGSALACLLVVISQFNSKEINFIIFWLCLVFVSIGIRIWFIHKAKTKLALHGYDSGSAFHHAMTTCLSGIAWGLGGLLVKDATPIALIITTTAIQTMVMGGVLTLGIFMPAFLAFAIPAFLPMIFVFAFSGGVTNFVLALYSSIFLILMIGIAFRFNKSQRNSCQITFEKEDIVKSLTDAHETALAAKFAADQAIKELEKLSTTDQLTGLYNRRRLDQILIAEQNRMQRYGQTLSVILIDIDKFKLVNDLYGHLAGDKVLSTVTHIMGNGIRDSDSLGRWGGEEFMVICSNTELEGAMALAEKLLLLVRTNEFEVAGRLTCSSGVAQMTQEESIDSLISRADSALYRAKEGGRNCVACDNFDEDQSFT